MERESESTMHNYSQVGNPIKSWKWMQSIQNGPDPRNVELTKQSGMSPHQRLFIPYTAEDAMCILCM